MKKISGLVLASILVLAGCGNKGGDTEKPTKEAAECKIKVGFVTDMGGIDDRSFNEGSYKGIQQFQKDNGLDDSCITYLESKQEADYLTNLSTLAEDGYDLVVAAGYLFEDSIKQAGEQFPDTKFLVIDGAVGTDNIQGALFAANEASYLAGVAAATEAKELGGDAVGFIGGAEGPVIGAFQAGFEQGALSVDPEIKIHIDYAASFDDTGKAQTLAKKQYDSGVKVIFHAAGNAGNGVIKEAQTRAEAGEEVYVVGVDLDQYEQGLYGDKTKSIILTSALKRVEVASYNAAKDVMEGNFKGGIVKYTLKEDGVGYPKENPNLDEEVTQALDTAVKDIKEGKITVSEEPTIKNGSTNK